MEEVLPGLRLASQVAPRVVATLSATLRRERNDCWLENAGLKGCRQADGRRICFSPSCLSRERGIVYDVRGNFNNVCSILADIIPLSHSEEDNLNLPKMKSMKGCQTQTNVLSPLSPAIPATELEGVRDMLVQSSHEADLEYAISRSPQEQTGKPNCPRCCENTCMLKTIKGR